MPQLLCTLMTHIPRKTIAAVIACLVLAGASLGVAPVPVAHAASCNDNYIIRCGVSSPSQLAGAYQSDSYVQKVYSYFGISSGDVSSMSQTSTNGYVTKSGDVVVNGQTVATNAITAGRDFINGSTKVDYQGITFYKRPPSVSFLDNQLAAYVVLDNQGQFAFAVLPSCGNPVMATPKPQPKPQPKPSAQCTSLSLDKLDTLKYRATATYTVQNATFKNASFDFGDQTQAEQGQNGSNNTATAEHTYQNAGNYTVTATLTFSSSSGESQDVNVTCSASVSPTTPAPPPAPAPQAPAPSSPPQALPNTGGGGIATMAGIFSGSAVLGTAAYRFRLGRKLHK